MKKLAEVCELKHKLFEDVKNDIDTLGIENVNICKVGMQIDIVKDLASIEKDCLESEYYTTVIEAMDGGEDRPGYDNWRYASGRYAPKGHGHRSGYPMMSPTIYNAHMMEDYDHRMGYPMSQTGTTKMMSRSGYPIRHDSYNDYVDARRHYHETGSDNDRMIMDHHADQYIHEMTESVRDMWEDATPDQKKKIKGGISKILAEMQM